MPTLLPKDDDDHAIPAMRLKDSGAHAISASGTSARNTTAFASTTKVVSVYATVPVYLRFGTSSVTAAATDHYYPENTYYDFAISGGTVGKGPHSSYLAVLAVDDSGTVYISEKE